MENLTVTDFEEIGNELLKAFSDIGFAYLKNSGINRANPIRPGDLKEAFDVSGDACFLESTVWPDDIIPGFSGSVLGFMDLTKQLPLRVLEALSYGMKLKDDHHLTNTHALLNKIGNVTAFRTLYYPPIPKNIVIKDGQLRLGEHSDYGTVTLIFQDDVGGLQFQQPLSSATIVYEIFRSSCHKLFFMSYTTKSANSINFCFNINKFASRVREL